ncbi:hypothetical protein VNI00_009841 [Paramarasmius palmivorus]|uniref:F-box domain-containing protein n=1 Tax=Paramarasmius palmivorus TaxID=297713 RepID=A0AAW0CMX0_9AGAR
MDIDPENPRPSLVDLPPTTHDAFLASLPPQDRFTYARVSKKAFQDVQAFCRRAFKVEKVLLRYFDHEEIRRFRILQHAIGFIVSGSTALSFFTREPVYPNSDLDIYVDVWWCAILLHFLESQGYNYQPIITENKRQSRDVYQTLDEALSRSQEEWNGHLGFLGGEEHYFNRGIKEVFNFVRNGRKIQVIACAETPLEVILEFHSTVVMCLICYSHAVCLYPRATFVDQVTLANYRWHNDQDDARQKYRERGWTVTKTVDALRGLKHGSDLSYFDYRHVGDSRCWTIPLDSPGDFTQSDLTLGDFDNTTIHAWGIMYHWDGECPELCFNTLWVPELQQSFCLPPNLFHKVERDGFPAAVREDPARLLSGLKALVDQHIRPMNPTDNSRENARKLVVDAFDTVREKFPSVPKEKLPPLRAGSIAYRCVRTLLENLKVPPEISIGFKQDTNGFIWTQIRVKRMPQYLDIYQNKLELEEQRVELQGPRGGSFYSTFTN